MEKKTFYTRIVGSIALMALLVVTNVPGALAAFYLFSSNISNFNGTTFDLINQNTLVYGYGYNNATGLYGYGYGYGYNYWLANGQPNTGALAGSQTPFQPNFGGNNSVSGTVPVGGSAPAGTYTGAAGAKLDYDLVGMQATQVEQISLTSSTTSGLSMTIPANTTITFPTGSDGTIRLPQVETVSGGASDPTGVSLTSIVGAGGLSLNQHITLSNPVSITIPGVLLQSVYYKTDTAGTWVSSDGVCSGAAGMTLGAGQNVCFYYSGGNTIVVTNRLSQFGGGAVSGSSSSSSGGGGGGGGGPSVTTTTTTTTKAPAGVVQTSTVTTVKTPSGKDITVPAGTKVRMAKFTDVPASSWYFSYVEVLRKAGIITGTTAGLFEPSRSLTRAELVKIALNTFAITVSSSVSTTPFKDVPRSQWYATYVMKAKELGIITGYADGTFRPNEPVNRVEALKILLIASGLEVSGGKMNFKDTVKGAWYEKYVAFAQEKGVIKGYPDGSFGPANHILRSEMAKIAVVALELVL